MFAVIGTKLAKNGVNVILHRSSRNEEPVGDFSITQPLTHQAEHSPLAIAQLVGSGEGRGIVQRNLAMQRAKAS